MAEYSAILLNSDDSLLGQVESRVTVMARDYSICLSPDLSDFGIPLRFPTNIQRQVPINMTQISEASDHELEVTRQLLLMKSRLSYSLVEEIGIRSLYVNLDNETNSDKTYQDLYLTVYYDLIPLRSTPEVYQLLKSSFQTPTGLIVLSCSGLFGIGWRAKGIFKDIWELELSKLHPDKELIMGSRTEDLYIRLLNLDLIDEVDLTELADQFRDRARWYKPLGLFPRQTPQIIIDNRNLYQLLNGQWSSNTKQLDEIDLSADFLIKQVELPSLSCLLALLEAIGSDDLQVLLIPNNILVQVKTVSLSRYLEFEVNIPKVLINPDREVVTSNKPILGSLSFWNSTTQSKTWIAYL